MRQGVLFFILFFSSLSSNASSICDYYKAESPSMYKMVCSGGGSSTSKPAGANSSLSESFNVSPAALPTEPSSYGIEFIGSYIRNDFQQKAPTFSIVKGFHKFGAGFSTSGNNTFHGNDMLQRIYGQSSLTTFQSLETEKSKIPSLNLGTAISVVGSKSDSFLPKLDLGLSLRHNAITDTWGGGPALIFGYTHFTFGGGFTREKISQYLPQITFTSFLVTGRLSIFELEFTQLRNYGGYSLQPINILTGSVTWRSLILTAAVRELDYVLEPSLVRQYHFAIQYQISKEISAGAMYNYIPGASSVAFQYYL